MAQRMFGLETEYAVTVFCPRGSVERGELLERLLGAARRHLTCLPDARSTGVYLQNGARLYVDTGGHPELATPECTHPSELVRYLRAGERILLDLGRRVQTEGLRDSQICWFISNVDYSGSGATWGCHESYLHRTSSDALAEQLIPHLVTRVIYCGAGGFNNLTPALEFTLSPRAFHMERVVSGDSTSERGIFHTKDEPLARRGYHRLHLLCGESLCSEIATWLKIGATALVVALTEAGFRPGRAVQLADPLKALRTVAGDLRCRALLELSDGRRLSALQIQRHYLAQVEERLDHEVMPPWAPEVCRHWRRILDLLEAAPASVAGLLDWAIKWNLYAHHARRRGFSWEILAQWNDIVADFKAAFPGLDLARLNAETLISPDSPVLEQAAALTPRLRQRGLGWGQLACFEQLRAELLELDTRFGELGERGVFAELDRQGLLDHHAPGADNILHAMFNPPACGRARLRGEAVRKLVESQRIGRCHWDAVWDLATKQVLDLSDPFAEQEQWQPLKENRDSDAEAAFTHLFEQVLGVRRFGRRRP